MSETTTNGQPIRLRPTKGKMVSLDELVDGLSASGSSQDPADWIRQNPEAWSQSNPEERDHLERHQGDPVPRNHAFRRGLWIYLVSVAAFLGLVALIAWLILGTP